MAAVNSREFTEWMVFDEFEPIGTRTVPDLLALLIVATVNPWLPKGSRHLLPQDIFPDPLLPARLSEVQEAQRTAQVAQDYVRLRKERLAKMAEQASTEGSI